MNAIFFDCTHGVRKDTFASSLVALLPDPEGFMARLGALDLPGCSFDLFVARERGMVGVFLSVAEENALDSPAHHHHGVEEVRSTIRAAGLGEEVLAHALGVYDILAEAEAAAHGVAVTDVHFHEVGSKEAIAYVCAACMAMVELAPSRVVSSEVCTGFGHVDCAHGRLPIPAPATANVLADVPTFAGPVEGELATPTGAALLRHFAQGFGDMPTMTVEAFGYGVGRDGLDSKSTLRAVLGKAGA